MTLTLITAIVSALVSGGGLVAVVNALASRRKVRTDAAARLSDEALRWVGEFQEEAKAARTEAAALRKETAKTREEAQEARAQVAAVTVQAEALGRQVQALRAAILDPQVTREQLHDMVRP